MLYKDNFITCLILRQQLFFTCQSFSTYNILHSVWFDIILSSSSQFHLVIYEF